MKLLKVTFSLMVVAFLIPAGVVTGRGMAADSPAITARTPAEILANPNLVSEKSDGPTGEIQLISSGESGLTFSVAVPWEELAVETTSENGAVYSRVSLPGWAGTSQVGAPRLPMTTGQIGVPFGAGISVEVTPGEAVTIALDAPVIPVPAQTLDWTLPDDGVPVASEPGYMFNEDSSIYAGAGVYPQNLVELANDDVIRGQRVAGIAIYPVQYNPATDELTVFKSLEVRVTFSGGQAGDIRGDSEVYENFFDEQLLNAEEARPWRQSSAGIDNSVSNMGGQPYPWNPPSPSWRVKVRADGIYKLTYAELDAAGLAVDTLDPMNFQLYYLGNEVAIYVEGEADHTFDSDDYILFYGQKFSSKYTLDNVYWLTYGQAGVSQGLRMTIDDGTPGTAATPASFDAYKHYETNKIYWSLVPGDERQERWMWDYLQRSTKPSLTKNITLGSPYSGAGTLTVSLLGFSSDAIAPDHHVRVSLNGTTLDDFTWDGQTFLTEAIDVPAGVLIPGSNALQFQVVNDLGASNDTFYLDWFELDFPDTFLAQSNVLAFNQEAGDWKFQVDGFTSDQVLAFNVTNPAAVHRILNLAVSGSGPYSIQFEDSSVDPSNYWATTDSALLSVQAIEPDTQSDLGNYDQGADHIIISHASFLSAAETLRAHREDQGLRAMVVNVQDIYDQFNYGIVDVEPIREFLAYTRENWEDPAPSFVVLLGDGHYDPNNYAGYGRTSFIPPYLAPVDPWIKETAADNRYVVLDDADIFPDMMLGRMAVNTLAEANAFINKVIAYDVNPSPGDWQLKVMAVADNEDVAGNFDLISDGVLSCCLPPIYQDRAERVYFGITHDLTGTRAAIQNGFNTGRLIINYIGHAAYNIWGDENFFATSNVAGLSTTDKFPVVLAMTCREGSYFFPDATLSVAEVITRAENKGAVASWSPTGLGVASGHDYLDRGFFNALFSDGAASIGDATLAGKLSLWATGYNRDQIDTYLLFGDPATKIEVIPPLPVITSISPTQWQANTAGFTLTVNGTDFLDGDTVYWNGAPLTTTYISPTRLTALVTTADIPEVDLAQVTVAHEGWESTPSNAMEFKVYTFADVLPAHPLWRYVEGFFAKGITTGCAINPLKYCPDRAVTRAEMAVFLLRAMHADDLTPYEPVDVEPDVFADVPAPGKAWMEPWIEQFYATGITTGCAVNPLRFCPERGVTRAEMAVFMLRAKGITPVNDPTNPFADVPVKGKEWMEPWIETFYNEGYTTGCGTSGDKLLYCPERGANRVEMATFIVRIFEFPQLP